MTTPDSEHIPHQHYLTFDRAWANALRLEEAWLRTESGRDEAKARFVAAVFILSEAVGFVYPDYPEIWAALLPSGYPRPADSTQPRLNR